MQDWPTELGYRIDVFTIFALLGVVQGFFLAAFFIVGQARKYAPYRYLGYLLLALSCVALEIFLCYSGAIVHTIHLVDFSEPNNFLFVPLMYFIAVALTGEQVKKWYLHLVPFGFYFVYHCCFFFQSTAFKFNAFRWSYHPYLPELENKQIFHADPWGIKSLVNELSVLYFLCYLPFILSALRKVLKQNKLLKINDLLASKQFAWWTGFWFLMFLSYGLWAYKVLFIYRDLGDYVGVTLTTFIIYYVNFFTLKNNLLAPVNLPTKKYQKSSLAVEQQDRLLTKAIEAMTVQHLYQNPALTLKVLAEKIETTSHHLSQVLNEKLQKTYYEWIAEYRVEEAKRLLTNEANHHYTLETIGKMAGFNSRSAFYKAFNRLVGETPANYRKKGK